MEKTEVEKQEDSLSNGRYSLRLPEGSIRLSPVVTSIIQLVPANVSQEEMDESLSENWDYLSCDIKADTILIQCMIKTKNLKKKQAMERLAANKRVLKKLLSVYLDADLEAFWQGLFIDQQNDLTVDLNIKKFFYKNPLSSYEESLNYSLPLLQQKIVSPVSINEIRLYYLREILNQWVDWDRAKNQLRNSLQVLKAVLSYYQRPFPSFFFQHAFDIENFPDIRLLDESALLWNKLVKGDMFQDIEENGRLSSHLLEQNYFHSLSIASRNQKIIDRLFSVNATGYANETIYFNGLSLKNAQGMTFLDLVNCTDLEAIPEYKNLSFLQRKNLLQEKFYQIGESVEYEVGSLFHSLASILMRIYYYQVAAFPFHHSQEHLIDLFKQTEANWELSKNYPIQPRLLLALHLAESNNIVFVADDWKIRMNQLFKYLSAEFEKELPEPPRFNRISAAMKILIEKGMSREKINQKRYYVMESDDPDLSITYYGTPLEQFLAIADWDGLIGKTMYYQGIKIEPRKELQQAEECFNSQLYNDPWVKKKAINNLKHQHKETTSYAIEQETKRIAENYKVETENHRAWIRGLKVWISTIPIIGPLYAIEEGLRNREPIEVVCGIIFLSLDALDFLSGAEHEPLNVEASVSRLSVRERVTVGTVHSSFKKLNLSPADLPLDDQMYLAADPFSVHYSNEVPLAYRFTAQQVRSGVQGLTWRDYPLVHLADANRVVPVKSEGGAFREVNWSTGEVDPKKHLIYKDRDTGKFFSHTASLKGGNPSLELTEEEIRQRITVQETEEILLDAHDYVKYNFDRLFIQCFNVAHTISLKLNIQVFYKHLYTISPTFRRIFNNYHEIFVTKNLKRKWSILVESNAVIRTDFEAKVIYISSDREIANTYYVSNDNAFVPSQPERIYLHEILHALTGKQDPIKIVAIGHRGPIVFLTDKILSEAGYLFPQRMMYRRLSHLFEGNPLQNADFQWRQFREKAKILVAQENTYLDRMVDKQVPVAEYKKIFGEDLSARYTIKELDTLRRRLHTIDRLVVDQEVIFEERFRDCFTAENRKVLDTLIRFYTNIYIKSKEFFYLFEVWYSKIKTQLIHPWKFELNQQVAQLELPIGKRVHCINDLTRKIYIFDDATLYLSDKGLLNFERTQQLVHELVQLMTELKDPPPEIALKNRGAVVQITDKILEQAGFRFERRLIYELATADDPSKQSLLLSYQLEASRAANLEDRLIKDMHLEQQACVPRCRSKRSFLKKMDVPIVATYSMKEFSTDKNLATTKKNIRNYLKKYRITEGENTKFVSAKKFIKGWPFFEKNTSSFSMDVSAANTPWIAMNHSLSN